VLSSSKEGWVEGEIKNLRNKRERLATSSGGTKAGWSAGQLAGRKETAASRIEELSRAASPAQAVASLKSELQSVGAGGIRGGSAIAALRPEREKKAKTLASLKSEEATIEASLSSGKVDDGRIEALRTRKSQVEDEIAALEQLASPAAAAAVEGAKNADPEEIRATAARLMKPCLKCHVENGIGLQATSPARDVLGMSTFTHAPHLKQAACMDCHSSILDSEKAGEAHFAGLDKCRDCHRWGGTEARCGTCHLYHPGPAAGAAPLVASLPVSETPAEGER